MTGLLKTATGFRPARFVIVGFTAALLLFVLTFLFNRIGVAPFASGALAYAIAFALAYTLQRQWTFGSTHSHAHALPRYFAVQAGCAILSGCCTYLAHQTLNWPPLIVSAVTTLTTSAASFVFSSRWVFPDTAHTEQT